MNAVVQPIFRPDTEAMTAHVEHLFGGYLDGYHDGLIELAWTHTTPDETGKYSLKHARLFGTDQLAELVDEAFRLNSTPMCNVYIGAALRKPGTPPFGRASDSDAWVLTAAYVDLDDPGAALAAKDIYGSDKPTMVVVTGRAPHVRAQLWWRLDEPLTDADEWPELLRGVAAKLSGDSTVTNPARVMRLAGSIAWPVKPERVVEHTHIAPLKAPGLPTYGAGHLAHIFPPVAAANGAAANLNQVQHTTNGLGLSGKIADGREAYMVKTIAACLLELIGTTGAAPTPQALFDAAWPQYERNVDLTRSGRGADEFARKCTYTIRRFERGEIRGIETVDKAVEQFKRKRPAQSFTQQIERAAAVAPLDTFETLSIVDIDSLPPPTWLVDATIPEFGLTFIYGKPGKGKSFVSLDLALRIAHGLDWHGRECRQGGVLYIAGEGKGGYRNRVRGWHLKHGITTDSPANFRLLPRAVNFMNAEEVAKLVRTVKAVVGDAKLVVIDTVARSLPGAEENASKEMGMFIAACDAIKDACGVAVLGVHHSGKDEERGMRGSSALEGAGDCVLHLRRGDDSNFIEVVTEKQKDGEEAKPFYMTLQKVEWMDGLKQASTLVPEVAQEAPQRAVLDKPTCRKILAEIERAWDAGKPWSHRKQTRGEGRYLPQWMVRQTQCSHEEAVQLIADWLANDVLVIETVNTDSKAKGLKVIGSID